METPTPSPYLSQDEPPATLAESEASARLARWALANGWTVEPCGDGSQGWQWFRPSRAGGEPLLVCRAFPRAEVVGPPAGKHIAEGICFFGRALEDDAVREPVWAYATHLSPEALALLGSREPDAGRVTWACCRLLDQGEHSLAISVLCNGPISAMQALPAEAWARLLGDPNARVRESAMRLHGGISPAPPATPG